MWIKLLDVKYYYIVLDYMVYVRVMVTDIQKQGLLFCFYKKWTAKQIAKGLLKSPCLYNKRRHGAVLCVENTLKLFFASQQWLESLRKETYDGMTAPAVARYKL